MSYTAYAAINMNMTLVRFSIQQITSRFVDLESRLNSPPASTFNEVAVSIQVVMLQKNPANTAEVMRERCISTTRAAPDTSSSQREITTHNRKRGSRGLVLPPTTARDERLPLVEPKRRRDAKKCLYFDHVQGLTHRWPKQDAERLMPPRTLSSSIFSWVEAQSITEGGGR